MSMRLPVFCAVQVVGVLLVACLGRQGMAAVPQSAPAIPPELSALVADISKAERQLKDLYVESSCVSEEADDLVGPWRETPERTQIVARYSGVPGSQCRIDVIKRVSPWQDGPAPWGESSGIVAYDGQAGRIVTRTAGAVGQAPPPELFLATITNGRPLQFQGASYAFDSGAAFSIFLYREWESRSLSAVLIGRMTETKEVPGAHMIVDDAVADGVKCKRVRIGKEGLMDERWYVDPHRGFALIRYEYESRGRVESVKQVLSLQEAAPHIWYPTEAVYYNGYLDKPRRRMHYRASKVLVNTAMGDEIYRPDFPAGYRVNDKVANKWYTVGPATRPLEKDVDTIGGEARK